MTDMEIDSTRCPLCGGPNECEIAEGASKCWCFEVHIPAEVLERIPPEAQSVVCVCKRCATGGQSPAER
jgi:hypothetical protein